MARGIESTAPRPTGAATTDPRGNEPGSFATGRFGVARGSCPARTGNSLHATEPRATGWIGNKRHATERHATGEGKQPHATERRVTGRGQTAGMRRSRVLRGREGGRANSRGGAVRFGDGFGSVMSDPVVNRWTESGVDKKKGEVRGETTHKQFPEEKEMDQSLYPKEM